MSRRRIVVIDQYFPPDTSATARIVADFAGACREAGAPLTIVCGYPSYDPTTRNAWLPLRRVRGDGHTRYVVGSTGFDRRSAAGRVLNYVTFMFGAALVMPFVTARAAVVVMTDPPMAPLLAWWVRRVGRPASVCVWMQDLHPEFGVAAGLLRNGLAVRLWRRALQAALRVCDEVVVLGRDMEARIAALGVAVTTTVVHNGWSGVVAAAPRAAPAQPLRVMHFGNLGFAGPWESVIEAARELRGIAEFVFVGGGAGEAAFAGAPENVSVLPRVAHEEVSTLAADADLLLVGVRHGLAGYVVPSKGYEALALGRPPLVVADADCEIRRIVSEHRCGLAVDDRVDAVVRAVRTAAELDLREMAAQALAVAPQFARAVQFATLVAHLSPT